MPRAGRRTRLTADGGAALTGGRFRAPPRTPAGTLLLIAAGGAAGGEARYVLALAWRHSAGGFPWATLAINVSGSYLLGMVVVVASVLLPGLGWLRPLLATGFCGAFTTFSTWTVDTDRLLARGAMWPALLDLLGTLAGSLSAAWLGMHTARLVASRVGPRLTGRAA